jgi:hypothetical protein
MLPQSERRIHVASLLEESLHSYVPPIPFTQKQVG